MGDHTGPDCGCQRHGSGIAGTCAGGAEDRRPRGDHRHRAEARRERAGRADRAVGVRFGHAAQREHHAHRGDRAAHAELHDDARQRRRAAVLHPRRRLELRLRGGRPDRRRVPGRGVRRSRQRRGVRRVRHAARRGAAWPAGHAVRAQHLGRRHQLRAEPPGAGLFRERQPVQGLLRHPRRSRRAERRPDRHDRGPAVAESPHARRLLEEHRDRRRTRRRGQLERPCAGDVHAERRQPPAAGLRLRHRRHQGQRARALPGVRHGPGGRRRTTWRWRRCGGSGRRARTFAVRIRSRSPSRSARSTASRRATSTTRATVRGRSSVPGVRSTSPGTRTSTA